MNEELDGVNAIIQRESVADEIATNLLVDDSSLMPTDITEDLIETFESSDVTAEEQEEAVEEAVEEAIGSNGTDNISGREENDVIVGVDPQLDLPGLGETDIFSGGSESERFILGDRTRAYYDDGDDSTTGDDDVALIFDFNSNEDVIQLHGNPEDYTLVDFAELGKGEAGTAIFLNGATNDELIGSLNNVGGLSLDAAYFRFENGSPAQPVLESIEQY